MATIIFLDLPPNMADARGIIKFTTTLTGAIFWMILDSNF
jgi:hypothetical protein